MDATSLAISLGLDAAPVKAGLKDVLDQFAAMGDEMTATLENIKGFNSLRTGIAATSDALQGAKSDMDALAEAMRQGAVGEAITADFQAATGRVDALRDALAGQSGQLADYRQSLQAVGVDVHGLAAAEDEVKASYAAGKTELLAMAQVMRARDILGVKSHKDIQAEIERTKAAYKALSASGQLSAKEQAQAWVAMRDQVHDLKNETNGWWQRLMEAKVAIIAAAGAFLGLYKVVKGAIGGAIEYERAFAGVKMTVKGTAAELQAVSDGIVKLARELPIGTTELNAIAEAGGRMGIGAGDILKFTKGAGQMSAVWKMAVEEVGFDLRKLKDGYKMTADEAVDFGDTIDHLGDTMGVRQSDIMEGMARVASGAKQFGLAKDEAAALTATFVKLIPMPRTAAGSMKVLFDRMERGGQQGEEFQDALRQIGLSAEQLAEMVNKNPKAALDTFLGKLAQLDAKKQPQIMAALFGPQAQDDIAAVVNQYGVYQEAMAAVADKTEAAGSVARRYAEYQKSAAGQLQTLHNRIGEVGDALGATFLPALNQIVDRLKTGASAVADFVNEWPKLSGGVTMAVTGFAGLTAVLAAHKALYLLMPGPIQKVIQNLGGIKGALAAIRWKQWGLDAVDALKKPLGAANTLKGALGGLAAKAGALAAAFSVGWEFGNWLNQFDIVKKAGLIFVHTLNMAWLDLKKTWATLFGSKEDVAAINRQIDIAKQAYAEAMRDIETGADKAAQARIEAEKRAQEEIEHTGEIAKESAKSQQAALAGGGMAGGMAKYSDDALEAMNAWKPEDIDEEQAKALEAWRQRTGKEADVGGYKEASAITGRDETPPEKREVWDSAAQEQWRQEQAKAWLDDFKTRAAYQDKQAEEQKRLDEETARQAEKREQDGVGAGKRRIADELAAGMAAIKQKAEAEKKADDEAAARKKAIADSIAEGNRQAFESMSAEDQKAWQQLMAESHGRVPKGGMAQFKADREAQRQADAEAKDNAAKFAEQQSAWAEEQKKRQDDLGKQAEDAAKQAEEEAAKKAEAEQQAAEKAKSAWTAYYDKIAELTKAQVDRQKGLADQLEEISKKAKGGDDDPKKAGKAAYDLEKKARAAMKGGDFQNAQALADQAREAYAGLQQAGDMKSGKLAYAGVSRAGELGMEIAKQMKEALTRTVGAQLAQATGGRGRDAAKAESQGKTVTLKFGAGQTGGMAASGQLQGSQNDIDALLRQLEQQGLSAIR